MIKDQNIKIGKDILEAPDDAGIDIGGTIGMLVSKLCILLWELWDDGYDSKI